MLNGIVNLPLFYQQIQRILKIGIVGAGVAGLGVAVRLAAQGHEVDVYEANAYPGGKLSQFELRGYRFDAGPSLFTMPQYVDELFRIAGENPADHFRYYRLPVVCNYFWEDGTSLSAHADPAHFGREVQDKLGVDSGRLADALSDSARKYELTGRTFLEKPLNQVRTWWQAEVGRAMLHLHQLDLLQSMHQVHERRLQHPKLVQLFNRFATYNGSNPYKAPGLLSIIPHFEHQIGAFYPEGGMYAITQAIHQLAERQGARFHFETPVERILIDRRKATGLQVAREKIAYDRVISNMDVFFTYQRLLAEHPAPQRILRQQKSTSALIFYWGIERTFEQLDLHNIFFSDNYRTEFDALESGSIVDDPTVYVNISQRYSPEDAPAGGENWFVMINAPFDDGQDWDAIIPQVRQLTIDKLSRMLETPVEPLIACEATLEPRTIQSKTGSHLGALYGTSSNNRMAAFLRHANKSRRFDHLYFCGGSVHPGGGIPLALSSAKIVDELIHGRPSKAITSAPAPVPYTRAKLPQT